MLYETVFRELHRARVRYLIVGAVAVNLHGVPRMTADLHLMLDLQEANLRTFVDAVSALGYRPRIPVSPVALLDPTKRRDWRETSPWSCSPGFTRTARTKRLTSSWRTRWTSRQPTIGR